MAKSTAEILDQAQTAQQSLVSDENSGSAMPNLGRFFREVGEELKHQLAHGAHELANLNHTGNGYVMYEHQPNAAQPDHGLPVEAQKVEPMQQPAIESEGMSM